MECVVDGVNGRVTIIVSNPLILQGFCWIIQECARISYGASGMKPWVTLVCFILIDSMPVSARTW